MITGCHVNFRISSVQTGRSKIIGYSFRKSGRGTEAGYARRGGLGRTRHKGQKKPSMTGKACGEGTREYMQGGSAGLTLSTRSEKEGRVQGCPQSVDDLAGVIVLFA